MDPLTNTIGAMAFTVLQYLILLALYVGSLVVDYKVFVFTYTYALVVRT